MSAFGQPCLFSNGLFIRCSFLPHYILQTVCGGGFTLSSKKVRVSDRHVLRMLVEPIASTKLIIQCVHKVMVRLQNYLLFTLSYI